MSIALSISFFLFIILVGTIGFFKGKKKDWEFSFAKLIILILSAFISVIISKAVSKTVSSSIYTILDRKVFSNDIRELIASVPSLQEILHAIMSIILAPIVFYPVFVVVRIICGFFKPLVKKIVIWVADLIKKIEWKKLISKKSSPNSTGEKNNSETTNILTSDENTENKQELSKNDNAEKNLTSEIDSQISILSNEDSIKVREITGDTSSESLKAPPTIEKKKFFKNGSLASALISLTSALVASVIYLAPITGSLATIGTVENTVSESDLSGSEEIAPMLEIVDSITDNAGIKTINALGGKGIYNSLTSFKVNKEKIKLNNEISFFSAVANVALMFNNEEIDNAEKSTALKQIVPAFEKSTVLPIIMSEILSKAASAWERGEDYFGIEAPSIDNEQVEKIITDLYSLFKDSNKDTISKDVSTIINIFAVAIENGITDLPDDDPLAILKNKELTSKLLFEFINNSHLNALIKSFTSMGLSMICEAIGIPDNYDGLYEEMTTAISELENSKSTKEFSDSIYEIFHNYGIDITSDSAKKLANLIKDDNNYLLCGDKKTYVQNLLSTTNISINNKESQTTEVLLTESVFEEYSLTVTFETLDSNLSQVTITDAKKESEALSDVFASVSDFTVISGNEADVIEVINTIGKLLDKLASTETIGKTCVDNLIIALMQSNVVKEMIAMNDIDAAKFAISIISATKESGYESIMNSIANTIEALSSTNDNTSLDTLTAVLESLTPETANALKHLITPKVMESIGVEGEKAEAMSHVISNVFDNLANAKEGGITDDEYDAEIKIVSDIVNLTMSMTNESSSTEEIFSESADNGKTVNGYVDDVMNSKIIGNTIIDTVYGDSDTPTKDPLGSNVELSDSEKTILLDSLNEKLSAAKDDEKEETEKKVTAIAAFVNVEIVIVEGVACIVPNSAQLN